ncbi:MAG: phage terminase large subunit, partial [Ghiorsea sp.]
SEFIHASYSKRLATNNAYKTRALMMSEAYQAVFSHVTLKDDSKAKDEFRTTQGGIVYATGADGTITGYGAGKVRHGFGGALIIDDAHKANQAKSDVMLQNVIDWYQSTIESRLNSKETPIIVIMQRLHENDLSGWLLAGGTGEDWEHLCIPAINDDGEPLWAHKHDLTTLNRMMNADPYMFAGQYMQTPTPKDGGMFKKPWLSRYSERPAKRDTIRIVQSWDTAYKAAQINDPSCCTTWAETADGYYLLHNHTERMEYPKLKASAKALADEWQPDALLIEDKASGQSLIQELKGETSHPIIAIKPDGDKESRANAVTSLFEAGRVHFPHDAPWLKALEAELFMFPLGKHDDQVDSVSQALRYMKDKSGDMLPMAGFAAQSSIYGGLMR